jgi:hypothetical protein
MELPARLAYEILAQKGVKKFHHANSVITACQFLRSGALISRGSVVRQGMYQTPQNSDRLDRKYSVWFDVFADSVDIHLRASRINFYGPVLFVLDSEIVNKTYTGNVWVTKLNPTKWANKSHDQRWFTSAEDLQRNFEVGKFDQMIVFRHCGGELPFDGCLKEIVLDDPGLSVAGSNIDYYSMAHGALRLAMTEGRSEVTIKRRECPEYCSCIDDYESDIERTAQMFIPNVPE